MGRRRRICQFEKAKRRGLPVFLLSGGMALLLLAGCSNVLEAPAAAPSVVEAEASGGTEDAAPITVDPQEDWGAGILYFAIVDRFADGDSTNNRDVDRGAQGAFHGGDLVGLRQQLDELADLGVTALWITPVVKNIPGFVTGAGFPDWGYHGYWADDFYALDPRFGNEADLKALVDDCHRRGIKVLLDVVYNHAGYESRYTKDPQTRSWLRIEGQGGCGEGDILSCLAGLPDFKTELPEVADYLFEAHLGLAERVGLDGFRLDTVKHVTHEFWQEHRRRVDQRLGEDFFLLGEVWGGDARSLDPWFAGDEMDAGFDFSFQGSTLGFVRGRGRPVAYGRYLEKRHEVREGYILAPYLSSHDVKGALLELEGDLELFRLAALLKFTVAGLPTIYYGEEVARPGGDWPDNRSDMPWGDRDILPGKGLPRDEALRSFYKDLIAIRRAHPALWRGSHKTVAHDKHWLVFERRDSVAGEGVAEDLVLVAVNRAEEAATVKFELPAPWAGKGFVDLLSGDTFEGTAGEVELSVPPRTGRILAAADAASTDS